MLDVIQHAISSINNFLWSYLLVIMLIGFGLFFTFRSKFLQVRLIKEMVRVLKEGKSSNDKNDISPFQAFCISMAARVGTGNITGIAIAIALGGPGAVFWMWVLAIIGSASSFIESTLAQIYKVKDKTGFRGGPAYYMEKGLKKRWMGALFAILITLSFGLIFNAVQANTITLAFNNSFGTNRLELGIIVAILFAAIIFGGVKRIAKLSEYIVMIMAAAYILLALGIILVNIKEMPALIALIVKNAFGIHQAIGGTFAAAFMQGIKRGLFSNEAGMGSAPNAAATAVTSHPVKQGLIQAFGVLTDTLIICTSTAFIILLSGEYTNQKLSGIELTQAALSTHIGSWASGALAVTIFLFAFSTLIGNYYYGETNIEFISKNKGWRMIYRVAVIAMVIFGSIAQIQIVWDLADLFMGFMVIVNLIALLFLAKYALAALNNYQAQKKAGKDPVFYRDSIDGIEDDLEGWEHSSNQKQTKKTMNF